MKKLLIFHLLLLLAGMYPFEADAQDFYLKTTDLRVKRFDLSSLQSLSFYNENLVLKKTTGATETYALSSVSALYFSPLYTETPDISSAGTGKISVYPNPVVSVLRIINLPQRENKVYIFGTDGRMLLQASVTLENPEINISGLTKGFYILHTDNQAIKFIKQ